MHIVTNKLVGGYVSEIAAEGGSTIIVIEDSDTTANRKFQNYRYVQSKGLTELGAAVHPYGVVIIPDSVKERATAGEIDLSKYHVEVNFNREVYAITLSALLALEIGDGIEFVKTGLGYADGAVSAGIPPFYASLADKYLKINHTATGLEWADIPEELPEIESGDAGKVLTVNAGEDGVEWGEALPDTTGASAGDVLTIGEGGVEWAEVPDELPAIASGDAGKVLTVNAGETGAEWVTPTGGMVNPMTTSGDIIIGGSSGTPTRLAKGSNKQLLHISTFGNVEWYSPTDCRYCTFCPQIQTIDDAKGKRSYNFGMLCTNTANISTIIKESQLPDILYNNGFSVGSSIYKVPCSGVINGVAQVDVSTQTSHVWNIYGIYATSAGGIPTTLSFDVWREDGVSGLILSKVEFTPSNTVNIDVSLKSVLSP